jgi:methionyl-tRNA synthetase
VNSDLANGLGNLLSRTLTLIERSCGGVIPECGPPVIPNLENKIREAAEKLPGRIEDGMKSLLFKENLQIIWELLTWCDQYIDQSAPWALAKNPGERPKLNTVLYTTAEALRFVSVVLYPFMPQTAEEMKHQLGLMLNFSKPLLSSEITWGGLIPGTSVAKGKPLAPRIEATTTQGGARVTDTQPPTPPTAQTGPAAAPGGTTTQITIEDFQKIQLKVAKVLAAERVPKSDKLIKLQVDLGTEQRQIVAGIGKKYTPEELIGRRVVIVANLKPAKLMGVESQGMVLAAGDADVKELVTLMSDVDPGTKVK